VIFLPDTRLTVEKILESLWFSPKSGPYFVVPQSNKETDISNSDILRILQHI
jgi:hypothetical protein